MEFYRRRLTGTRRLGILAGSFNPPTVAHLELARAASRLVEEILCVVPRALPHKDYFGATCEQRLELLEAAGLPESHSLASTGAGLFIDIARECQSHYDPTTRLFFVCGRDAAERILNWDYGRAGVLEEMLREFELLVAPRGGDFRPPEEWRARIHDLAVEGQLEDVSSSEVRERIARGEPWEHLVPGSIRERVRAIYS